MLKYVRGLKFDEQPDYDWLKGLFSELFAKLGYRVNTALQWILETELDDTFTEGDTTFNN